jgi:transcriptional regulator with XRE-family HTH domain
VGNQRDDLDVFLDEQRQDPAFAGAYEDAQARADLIDRCVRLRKESGKTQADVAIAMGTTQSAVSDLETGATDPQLSTLQRYGRAVGARLVLSITAPQKSGTERGKSKASAGRRRRSAA